MKNTRLSFLRHLTFWVMLALISGILLGYFQPKQAVKMERLSTGFITIIKLFIVPIIFFTIVLGISGMHSLKKAGRIGFKSLLYFEVLTTLALVIGIVVAVVLGPGRVDRESLLIQDAAKYTSRADAPFDWVAFLCANTTLQVLILALIVGILLHFIPQRTAILPWLEKASHLVFRGLKYVMYLAPVGAFGGMAFTVGKFGLHTLIPLAKLMGTMYLTMAFFIFLVLGLVLRFYRMSIWSFLKYIKEELLIVLGTSSSETALPSLMQKLEKTGCSKSVVGLVIPTGYSFNLDGTSIYLSMAIIFLAQLYDVHLTASETLSIIGILMLTSKGAAGVTGSGFVILASTLSAIHRIPLEGLAFLLGIDKFMSEARAITNIIGNGVATIVISKSEREDVHLP